MEIRSKDLEHGQKEVSQEESKELVLPPIPKEEQPVYKNTKEVSVNKPDCEDYYDDCIFEYLKLQQKNCDFEIKLVNTVLKALKARKGGEHVLTFRELDICERKSVDLTSVFFWQSLFLFNGFITEGFEFTKHNPYYLRYNYNQGLKWYREKRERDSEEVRKKGDARIQEIVKILDEIHLPPRRNELENGFPVEMCRPEYLDFGQYNKKWQQIQKSKFYQRIIDPDNNQAVTDTEAMNK